MLFIVKLLKSRFYDYRQFIWCILTAAVFSCQPFSKLCIGGDALLCACYLSAPLEERNCLFTLKFFITAWLPEGASRLANRQNRRQIKTPALSDLTHSFPLIITLKMATRLAGRNYALNSDITHPEWGWGVFKEVNPRFFHSPPHRCLCMPLQLEIFMTLVRFTAECLCVCRMKPGEHSRFVEIATHDNGRDLQCSLRPF